MFVLPGTGAEDVPHQFPNWEGPIRTCPAPCCCGAGPGCASCQGHNVGRGRLVLGHLWGRGGHLMDGQRGHRCVWSHTEQKAAFAELKVSPDERILLVPCPGMVSACPCPSGTPWRPCKGGKQHPGESSTLCCAGASSDGEVWAAPAHLCVRKTKIQTGDFLWGG